MDELNECDNCKARASNTNLEQDHESSPTTSRPPVFSIVSHVKFVHQPSDYDSDSEDEDAEPDFLSLMESRMEDVTFEIECSELSEETTGRRAVEDMFRSISVPCRSFMIDEVLMCAFEMLREPAYANRKVFHMDVDVSLLVDQLPVGVSIVEESEDEEEEETNRPASIDELERVEVEGSTELSCCICLEGFPPCSEATRLPCSHLFHGRCIQQWLTKCNSCPLCRSEIN